jgi:hypothetical protein
MVLLLCFTDNIGGGEVFPTGICVVLFCSSHILRFCGLGWVFS